VLACDLWCVLCADSRLLGGEMPLVGAPPSRGKPWDPTGLQQALACETDRLLSSPTDVGVPGPPVVITRRPEPPRLRLLAPVTPPHSKR